MLGEAVRDEVTGREDARGVWNGGADVVRIRSGKNEGVEGLVGDLSSADGGSLRSTGERLAGRKSGALSISNKVEFGVEGRGVTTPSPTLDSPDAEVVVWRPSMLRSPLTLPGEIDPDIGRVL